MEMNRASFVSNPHPLIGVGRVAIFEPFRERETLRAYIERTQVITPAGEVSVWHNGYRVPDALWPYLIPHPGDQVIMRAAVHGGGGDGGKVLRTVATVAIILTVAVAAPAIGAAIAEMGLGVSAAVGTSLAGAVIMTAGSLLVNALIPLPRVADASGFADVPLITSGPSAVSAAKYASVAGGSQSLAAAAGANSSRSYDVNPTYSIAGGRNRARVWECMALVFGTHKMVPDLAANSYTEYVGDTQYLNQAFHFGLQGLDLEINDIRIGSTPISSYRGINHQIAGKDGKLSLFPGNVDTMQGFVLNASDGTILRTTPTNVTHIKVELAAQLYYFEDDGSLSNMDASFSIQYRAVGSGTWINIDGTDNPSVYATHYWSLQRMNDAGDSQLRGQVQYGSTNYADHTNGEAVIYDTICTTVESHYDESGNWIAATQVCENLYGHWMWTPHPYTLGQPWQGIAPDPLLSGVYVPSSVIYMVGASQNPIRRTVAWNVQAGQYEIAITKNTADVKTTRSTNESAVNQILCYQPDEADYTGQARMAVRIQASAQLQGAIEDLNAIVSARCPVMNDSGTWLLQKTSNPAWWFLWYARGKRESDGTRVYGGGLVDAQIDLDSIKAWAAFCDDSQLTFNYVLTQKSTVHDILTIIARAGRASYSWQTGKLGVVWDAANLPIVAMIGPYNIKAGTFSVSYANEATADKVIVNFINPNNNWELDTVRVDVPNVAITNTTATLDLDGCTNLSMAAREANLIAASQAFHRRRVMWEMDIEGMVATRGDVVQLSHDLTVWGYSGRLLAGDRATMTVDQVVPSDGSGWFSLRSPWGHIETIQVTSAVGDVSVFNISTPLSGSFPVPSEWPDENVLDWAWQFDPIQTPGRRIKIVDVQPSGDDSVKFIGVDDDADYYASENDPFDYTPPRDGALLGGVVFGVSFTERIVVVAEDITEVTLFWSLSSPDARVTVAISLNGVAQPILDTGNRSTTISARTNDVISVIVTPRSKTGSGDPYPASYTVLGLGMPLPPVTGLNSVLRDGLVILTWDAVVDMRTVQYEVRTGTSWTNSRTVVLTPTLEAYIPGNARYMVAARFATPWGKIVYGTPASLLITGSSIVRNLLATKAEHPLWDGALTGGAAVLSDLLTLGPVGDVLDATDVLALDDVLWYGGAALSGEYQTDAANIIDIGYPQGCRVDFSIVETSFNFHENVLSIVDIFADTDLLNDSNRQLYEITPQIRYAGEDAVFSDWAKYIPGYINARYFDVRLVLETTDPLVVPFVEQFTWSIDVPDLIQRNESVNVPATGSLTVAYTKIYHAIPNVQLTILNEQNGDRAVLVDSHETYFTVQVFNGATQVSRNINWISQGY